MRQLVQQEIYKKSRHIACYLPLKHEFDTSPIIHELQQNKICYLPVLKENNTLSFIRYDQNDGLHFNRYSILEPVELTYQISPEELDIVIMPLVAFDEKGHRLGAGGGFYDRTFHFLLNHSIQKPILIGLGYAAQKAEDLPEEKWDVKLNAMLTEKTFVTFG